MEISICSGDYRIGFSFIAYLLGLIGGYVTHWIVSGMAKGSEMKDEKGKEGRED